VLTAQQMRKQRGLVAVGAAVISAVITPTPDAVTMLMVMVPFLVLFELSVAVAAVLERRREAALAADDGESGWDVGGDEGPPPPPGGSGPATPAPTGPDPDGDPYEDWSDAPTATHAVATTAAPPIADDWVEDTLDETTEDEPAPHGEAPDPRLLGDPAGPRVAVDDGPSSVVDDPAIDLDWTPEPLEDDWLARADELDDADPYADDADDERGP